MHNLENERIKRAYFIYFKEARRLSEHSIDCAAAEPVSSKTTSNIVTSKGSHSVGDRVGVQKTAAFRAAASYVSPLE